MKKLLLVLLCLPFIGFGQTQYISYDQYKTVSKLYFEYLKVWEDLALDFFSEIQCISGNCKNGQGTYTWANGNKYVGEWKDGLMHGQGTYTWTGGNKYVGEYKNDLHHGQGTFTWADGTVIEGLWKNGDFKK